MNHPAYKPIAQIPIEGSELLTWKEMLWRIAVGAFWVAAFLLWAAAYSFWIKTLVH